MSFNGGAMAVQGVGSGGAAAETVTSHAVQTIAQSLAEANREKSAGAVNDGDENVGTQVNKYA